MVQYQNETLLHKNLVSISSKRAKFIRMIKYCSCTRGSFLYNYFFVWVCFGRHRLADVLHRDIIVRTMLSMMTMSQIDEYPIMHLFILCCHHLYLSLKWPWKNLYIFEISCVAWFVYHCVHTVIMVIYNCLLMTLMNLFWTLKKCFLFWVSPSHPSSVLVSHWIHWFNVCFGYSPLTTSGVKCAKLLSLSQTFFVNFFKIFTDSGFFTLQRFDGKTNHTLLTVWCSVRLIGS